jgi:hypothetical protein
MESRGSFLYGLGNSTIGGMLLEHILTEASWSLPLVLADINEGLRGVKTHHDTAVLIESKLVETGCGNRGYVLMPPVHPLQPQ